MTRIFWRRFLGAWLIAFLSLSLTRLLFYFNLRTYFEADLSELLRAMSFGLRFDAVSIAYLLGLFFIALPFIGNGRFSKISKLYFVGMLAAMNLLNCIDAEFFKFTARRSTDDLFEYAFLSDDVFNLAPNMVTQFWYLLFSWFFVVTLVWWMYGKVFSPVELKRSNSSSMMLLLPLAAVLLLAARGGFQDTSLSIMDAGRTENQKLNAVVLNTPFTILKTIGRPELKRFDFEGLETAEHDPIISFEQDSISARSKGQNVVIIIMESFAAEYVGAINGLEIGYTPFLDSLCENALVFTNAHANGHRSIEGIPAIVASIPTLMYEPYSTSRYANNRFSSLANLLAPLGYYSAFMHGGNENSMNFESFADQAGYQDFFDRDEYPFPDEHYDGIWGISDYYFLDHCVDRLSGFEEPFLGTIFTLSSHHPYSLPKEHQNIYPKGTLEIHESIGYADESLRQFFAKAAGTDWYDNTLFVITADHTSVSEHHRFQTKVGSLRIPIVFFQPNDSLLQGTNVVVMQQADIMPTVLDLLGYDRPFFSFGTSAFDTEAEHVAVAFKYDQYQLLKDKQLTCFDGENVTFVYDVTTDGLLERDLSEEQKSEHIGEESFLKNYLMNYSAALIDNRMTYQVWVQKEK